ncbi:MAG: hypothetical protein JWO47_473 [Candidatus Saccharibacteria bacterium]|nr:hypothetical protein [Candidatus Saccharibacteria bacterium]
MAKKPLPEKSVPLPRKLLTKFRRNVPGMSLLLIGFVAGVLWFGALRFLLVHPAETHYHANFAVYINGAREEFDGPGFYEEVAACTSAYDNNVKGRTHMHDNVNDVIHVHDKRVTYQDFFENIGWSIGPDYIHTDETMYANTDTSTVKYMLNGETVERVDNKIISDKDRLLISYGPTDEDVSAQFKTVASTAAAVDAKQDPATCGGLNGPGEDSFSVKLKGAIGIGQ